MKITNFRCENLNRHLTDKFPFNRDVTFLIGVNGSGKTTVVSAIHSLLNPDLIWLIKQPFDEIEVEFEINDKKYQISAVKKKENLILNTTFPEPMAAEFPYKYFRELYIDYLNNPRMDEEDLFLHIISEIYENDEVEYFINQFKKLPTPTYLGIDRTTNLGRIETKSRSNKSQPIYNQNTNLDSSLSDALQLVRKAYVKCTEKQVALTIELRKRLVLSTFKNDTEDGIIPWPTKQDLKKFRSRQKSISSTLKRLDIDNREITKEVNPFFEDAIRTFEACLPYESLEDAIQNMSSKHGNAFATETSEITDVIQKWFSLNRKLPTISYIDSLIRKYTQEVSENFSELSKFENNMEQFLADSGKSLFLDSRGQTNIKFKDGTTGTVFDMSSGEKQLFVLISHLSFNEGSKKSNVLIIDEPELSLHLKWQELFVNAVYNANKDIQAILATHSPAILSNNNDKCVILGDSDRA